MSVAVQVPAQHRFRTTYYLRADTLQVDKYVFPNDNTSGYEYAVLPLNFGSAEVKENKEIFEALSNARIEQVELVYTSYPEELDLYSLNEKRYEYLHYKCSGIFNNSVTKWKLIKQTDCKSKAEAAKLFHGFVIRYLPGASMEGHLAEFDELQQILKGTKNLEDTSLLRILRRNTWQNASVVADFTGSMSKYVAQVFMWLRQFNTSLGLEEFTFFNDGDRRLDYQKIIGGTGGIYYVKSKNEKDILQKVSECVNGGYGGDVEENDVEALLFAQTKNPSATQLILIGDNWAPVRDIGMIGMIKKPVRVIVCGKEKANALNVDLINIAYKTQGSIHTTDEDVLDLHTKERGTKFIIGDDEFIIDYGRVNRVYR